MKLYKLTEMDRPNDLVFLVAESRVFSRLFNRVACFNVFVFHGIKKKTQKHTRLSLDSFFSMSLLDNRVSFEWKTSSKLHVWCAHVSLSPSST